MKIAGTAYYIIAYPNIGTLYVFQNVEIEISDLTFLLGPALQHAFWLKLCFCHHAMPSTIGGSEDDSEKCNKCEAEQVWQASHGWVCVCVCVSCRRSDSIENSGCSPLY